MSTTTTMAEQNDLNSTPKPDESSSSNDVQLIDLSNDEEEVKANSVGKDLENGEDNDENGEENEDGEGGEDDDEEEEDEESNGATADVNTNGKMAIEEDGNEEEKNPNSSVADEDDEILISDDDEEDDEVEQLERDDETSQTKSENSLNLTNSVQEQQQQPQPAQTNSNKAASQNTPKEEIIIDDEDEVQDLSTKSSPPVEDLVPKLSFETMGFPSFLNDVITIGECLAINKRSRSDIDIDKEYSILDCPSQVVPLIVKKSNKFPAKLKQDEAANKPQNQPAAPNQNTKNMLTISDFYSSSVGKFLIGIGLSRVKQWYHKDAINKVRKQIRKEGEAEDLMEELKKQQEYLSSCRVANSSYIFPTKKCEHCEFKTEFKLVLNHHLAYPHMTPRKEYKCNYCQYSTRDPKVIIDHVSYMHEKRCFIELPPQLYECPICPYESGVKSKAATHIAKCLKFFSPERHLVNKDDYFPTITPKPITQEDIKIYEATLQALRYAALNPQSKVPQIPGLPPGLQQQMYMVQQQQLTRPTNRPSIKSNKNRPNPNPNPFLNQINMKNVPNTLYHMLSFPPAKVNTPAGISGLPNNAFSLINKASMAPSLVQPQPMKNFAPMNMSRNSMVANNTVGPGKPNAVSKPSNNVSSSNRVDVNPKGSFVMCEICDGYIKDLDQLRTHMHWIHKVRIHPKMLASRPPLNCQKCQWRFFTDQGLERHLLGAHGLVTSNMQDMVNSNQDGGRCTICGRVFTSKLVTHMSQAHKISLKPAHLSYKCTVCSATFNLYRLFENHVYMVHSGSVKRNADDSGATNVPPRKKAALDVAAANGN